MNLTTKIAIIGAASAVALGTIAGVSVFGVNASKTGSWNPKNWKVYKDACKMIEKVKETEKFGEKFKTDFTAFKSFISNKGKGEFKCICTKNGDKADYKFEYVPEDVKKEKEKKEEKKSDSKNPENVTVLVGYDAVNKFMEVYKDIIGKVLGNASSQDTDSGALERSDTASRTTSYRLFQESINKTFGGTINLDSAKVKWHKEGRYAKSLAFTAVNPGSPGKNCGVIVSGGKLVETPPESVTIDIDGVGSRTFFKSGKEGNDVIYTLKESAAKPAAKPTVRKLPSTVAPAGPGAKKPVVKASVATTSVAKSAAAKEAAALGKKGGASISERAKALGLSWDPEKVKKSPRLEKK